MAEGVWCKRSNELILCSHRGLHRIAFVHYLQETSAMKYWRYIIIIAVINLYDNDSKVKTFNQTHSSQFRLVNYFNKEPNQLIILTPVYTGYFEAIWIRPFHLGGALEKHLDLPSPYPTIACFLTRLWSQAKVKSSWEKQPQEKTNCVSQINMSISQFLRIVRAHFKFNSQADYCTTKGK